MRTAQVFLLEITALALSGCGFVSSSSMSPLPVIKKQYAITREPVAVMPKDITGQIRNRMAIVVGISDYQNDGIAGLKNLRFAASDADALVRHLVSSGFNAVDVLTDKKATLGQIRQTIQKRVSEASEEDFLVIFWAGHGCADKNDPNKFYLLTYDSDPEELSKTAYAMNEFQKDIFHVKARRLMVIADTCHAGGISDPTTARGIRGSSDLFRSLRAIQVISGNGEPTSSDNNASMRLVLTACESNEVSREDPKLGEGHGVFTYYLLQGLQGEADKTRPIGNGDGKISLGEILDYLDLVVPRETGRNQHPSKAGVYDRNLMMGVVR